MRGNVQLRHPQGGVALLLVILFAAALAGFMSVIMLQLQREYRATENYTGIKAASDAADAGLEYAVAAIWDKYLVSVGKGDNPSLDGFRGFLKSTYSKNRSNLLEEPLKLASGAVISRIGFEQTDNGDETLLLVRSIAEARGRERRAMQQFRVGGASFQGFDYALMANNMQCVFCHTVIDNVDRLNNTDSNNFNTFDRVKVAVLEELNIERVGSRNRIAGSIHTRGKVDVLKSKVHEKAYEGQNLSTFKAYATDESGKIVQDKKGELSEENITLTGVDGQGLPLPFGTMYTDYPTVQDEMTDGYMPTSIPALIDDSNGNRVVDDEEWKVHVASSTGGAISGGLAFGVAEGKMYEGSALPKDSNEAIKYLSTGQYDGNVILVGTDAEPIQIDGDVFVNGDVVITGKVKGTGRIQARNNLYFVGDTTNADGKTYGTAADGTQNLVGYAAGGNIVVGDFITAAAHNAKTYGPSKWTEFNRAGSRKTKLAYLSEDTVDYAPALDKGDYMSWSSQQAMKFNQTEYSKAMKDSSYVPRYYNLREGDRTYLYTHTTEERGLQYESWLMREMKSDELKKGALLSLGPKGGWLSDDVFKQIWWDDERKRDSDKGDRGFKIDGLLYTNNAIMGMMPTWSKHRSNLYGSLLLRGAAIASDLGIHASGRDGGSAKGYGFEVQYDKRVQNLLSVQDEGLTLTRSVRLFESPAFESDSEAKDAAKAGVKK